MQESSGKREVWEHAKECGLSDGIALIASYFDIADVCVIGNGRMTYIHERPRKFTRVKAIPTRLDYRDFVAATKAQKKHR